MRMMMLLACCLSPLAQSQVLYELDDIGARLPPTTSSAAIDIADNGVVVGTLVGQGERDKPFVLTTDGVTVLDGGYYDDRIVRAGNSSGLVVGNLPGTTIGWVRTGERLSCVPTPLDCESFSAIYSSSQINGVNDAGVFVGGLTIIEPGAPFRYQAYRGQVGSDGSIQTVGLGRYQGQRDTIATAISASGQIVGQAAIDPATGMQQPLFLADGVWYALGAVGRNYSPAAVNSGGVVVGSGRSVDGTRQFALRWRIDQAGLAPETLPALPGALDARANDVNASGFVVGTAYVGPSLIDGRGWLLADCALLDLNELLPAGSPWRIVAANAINAAGDIAANAMRVGESGTRAVVLRRISADPMFAHGFDQG